MSEEILKPTHDEGQRLTNAKATMLGAFSIMPSGPWWKYLWQVSRHRPQSAEAPR